MNYMPPAGMNPILARLIGFVKSLGSAFVGKLLDPPGDISTALPDDIKTTYDLMVRGTLAHPETALYASVVNSFYPNYFQKDMTFFFPIWAVIGQTQYSLQSLSLAQVSGIWSSMITLPFWNQCIFSGAIPNWEMVRCAYMKVEYLPDNLFDTNVATVLPFFVFSFYPTYVVGGVPVFAGNSYMNQTSTVKIMPSIPSGERVIDFGLDTNIITGSAGASFPTQWTDTTYMNSNAAAIGGVVSLQTPNNSVSSSGTTFQIGSIVITLGLEFARNLR